MEHCLWCGFGWLGHWGHSLPFQSPAAQELKGQAKCRTLIWMVWCHPPSVDHDYGGV